MKGGQSGCTCRNTGRYWRTIKHNDLTMRTFHNAIPLQAHDGRVLKDTRDRPFDGTSEQRVTLTRDEGIVPWSASVGDGPAAPSMAARRPCRFAVRMHPPTPRPAYTQARRRLQFKEPRPTTCVREQTISARVMPSARLSMWVRPPRAL